MKIGLIFAMQEELEAFLAYISHYKTTSIKSLTFYEATLNHHEVVMLLSGIGKVNASYATTKLLEHFQVDALINTGVAGGYNVKHQSIVCAEEVTYHDVDVRVFNYVKGQVPGLAPTFKADKNLLNQALAIAQRLHYDIHLGIIASGDQFVTSLEPLQESFKLYKNLYAIEMEAAAIAQVAHLEQVPFLIIRSISDVIGAPNQNEDFTSFLKEASQKAAKLLYEMILSLS